MGMFDTIRCEYPLPDEKVQNESFQTKSLDRLLDEYTITKRGRLILHKHQHYQSKKQDFEIAYHGDLTFYTSMGDRQDNTHEWFEYKARFTEGTVQWIKRIETSKEEICHTTN